MSGISPRTSRQALVYRMASKLQQQGVSGAPKSEAEKLRWVHAHLRKEADIRLSAEEERLRKDALPTHVNLNAMAAQGSDRLGDLFHYRDFPMFPGEYIPPEHNTLASLRDDLKSDLQAQTLKDAWMRISGGQFFQSIEDYYSRTPGLDAEQLGEIVAGLYPSLSSNEAQGLVTRVLETISQPDSTPKRRLAQTVSAEAVGLDQSPEHYANFLEWMSRLTETKAFKTEHSINEFTKRKFNREDVRLMNQNFETMSPEALQQHMADGYSHFYEVLKDYQQKVASTDSRAQVGVRIDPPEVDERTGCSFGYGKHFTLSSVAVLRENRDKTGRITINGESLGKVFRDESWFMEDVLFPFDEAGLDFRDFDVAIMVEGRKEPDWNSTYLAPCCRMAISYAIMKMLPIKRIPLRKSGLGTQDRRMPIGEHRGFRDRKIARRKFRKR